MIDSGCFGHVCLHLFAPKFLMVSSTNVETVGANNVQHCGQKRGRLQTCDDEQWQTNFDRVRYPFLRTSSMKRRGVTIIFNHDDDSIIFGTRQ